MLCPFWLLESAADLTSDQIELRIYPGANGVFELYEDAGDGYEYENGEYRVTRFQWEEAAGKLEIRRPEKPAEWFVREWNPKVHLIQ